MKNLRNKKILITGASGFIGSYLYDLLLKNNIDVIGIDNYARHNNKKKNINKCSIFDKKKFKNYVKWADIIIHLAAINGTKNFYEKPQEVFEVSIRGSINLYDILREIGEKNSIKKEIFLASSGEVYGSPPYIPTDEKVSLKVEDIFNNRFSYGGGKICQDLIGRYLISKIVKRCIIFRPHNVYGPNMGYDHVIPELSLKIKKSNKFIKIEGTGKETRSFCYITDFIEGIILLLSNKTKKFDIYNIGNQEENSINNLVKVIMKSLKKKLLVKNKKKRIGGTNRRVPSIKKIKTLGYKPKINLKNGIKRFLFHDALINEL